MHQSLSRRATAARIFFAIAVAAALWTIVLFFHGGFDTSVAGVRIRTNDPVRPMFIAFAAVFMFVRALRNGGVDPYMDAVLERSARLFGRVPEGVAAFIVAAGIVTLGVNLGSKSAG